MWMNSNLTSTNEISFAGSRITIEPYEFKHRYSCFRTAGVRATAETGKHRRVALWHTLASSRRPSLERRMPELLKIVSSVSFVYYIVFSQESQAYLLYTTSYFLKRLYSASLARFSSQRSYTALCGVRGGELLVIMGISWTQRSSLSPPPHERTIQKSAMICPKVRMGHWLAGLLQFFSLIKFVANHVGRLLIWLLLFDLIAPNFVVTIIFSSPFRRSSFLWP